MTTKDSRNETWKQENYTKVHSNQVSQNKGERNILKQLKKQDIQRGRNIKMVE